MDMMRGPEAFAIASRRFYFLATVLVAASCSEFGFPPSSPQAASNLTASGMVYQEPNSPIDRGGIRLTWVDNSQGSAYFSLRRKVNNSAGYSEIADLKQGIEAFEDLNVFGGSTYTYWIYSYVDDGLVGTPGYRKVYSLTPSDSATVLALGLCSLSTQEATSITNNSAIALGEITSDGWLSIIVRGTEYWSLDDGGIPPVSTSDGWDKGVFVSSLTGLLPGRTYYYRAYAYNSEGYWYGETKSFTTLD